MSQRQQRCEWLTASFRRMSLSQKVVVIVAVPLLFELLIFSGIWLVVGQAENQAQTAENASLLVNRTNAITNEIYAAGGSLAAFIATRSGKFDQRFNETMRLAENDLQAMEAMSLSKAQQDIVAKEKQCVSEMLSFLQSTRDKIGDASTHQHLILMHNQHKKAQTAAQNYLDSMKTILQLFEADAAAQRAALTQSKSMVSKAIGTGVVLSLSIAFMISFWFAKELIQQINSLSSKASKMVTPESMGEPSTGTDEMAELDRTLHHVGDLLAANAERERQLETMKNSFIAMISHDVRAPLTSMQSFLTLLEEGKYGTINRQGRVSMRALNVSLDHLTSLIEDMLTFASNDWQKTINKRHQTDFGVMLKDAKDIVQAAAEAKSISIITSQFPEQSIKADETRIVEVFVNLLTNSIKYCPQGSTIVVDATTTENLCKVRIADNGPGLQVQNVFEPFTRGTNTGAQPGRGLGLYLSRRIIEDHGGTLTVNNSVQEGTCFEITLPITNCEWLSARAS